MESGKRKKNNAGVSEEYSEYHEKVRESAECGGVARAGGSTVQLQQHHQRNVYVSSNRFWNFLKRSDATLLSVGTDSSSISSRWRLHANMYVSGHREMLGTADVSGDLSLRAELSSSRITIFYFFNPGPRPGRVPKP